MSRDTLKPWLSGILLTLGGFLLAYQFVDPAPPDSLVMVTGVEDGAYYLFAQRYREQLASHGIDLRLTNSNGSLDNVSRLSAGEADVAFVQGGAGKGEAGLLSLGSLYFEPLWVFLRGDLAINRLPELAGMRVAIGPPGSGTRAVALTLLRDNGLLDGQVITLDSGGTAAADALVGGEIDALMLVASDQSPVVRRLLGAHQARLLSLQRADAYTRLHRYLSHVRLPEGVIDLRENIPPTDIHMLAATANLVIREELHPALIGLLMRTADQVHGGGGLFASPGQFPSPDYTDYPLSGEAERYYKSGPPFLQRFLPFWAATLVDRLKVMLLPLVALMIPLVKLLPPVYRWRMRSRIYRWYRDLRNIDADLHAGNVGPQAMHRALDAIEKEVGEVDVPLSYAVELYDLRVHLALVRGKIHERESHEPEAAKSSV